MSWDERLWSHALSSTLALEELFLVVLVSKERFLVELFLLNNFEVWIENITACVLIQGMRWCLWRDVFQFLIWSNHRMRLVCSLDFICLLFHQQRAKTYIWVWFIYFDRLLFNFFLNITPIFFMIFLVFHSLESRFLLIYKFCWWRLFIHLFDIITCHIFCLG